MATLPKAPTPTSSPPQKATSHGPSSEEEAKELAFGQVWKAAGTTTHRPSLAQTTGDGGRRKSSVQFNTGPAEETIRRESVVRDSVGSAHRNSSISQPRMPSPPPPIPYHRGISFDTFATPDASAEAFSIQYKHQDFNYTPRTRTFICGTDAKDYSEYALEWTLDELVDDGDEIVCLRVIAEDSVERRNYRQEADRLLDSVIQKNAIERKAISMKMEVAVGKVTDVIQSMIQLYEPVAIIVGTRGRKLTGVEGLMPGSVSKYCLQRSPVPTIVVRPSSKRTKKKMQRQREAGRSVYTNILSKAQSTSSKNVLDMSVGDTFETRATDQEANEVEKAIGKPRKGILRNKDYAGPLRRIKSDGSEEFDEPPMQSFALPIGFLTMESAPSAETAMKSPMIQALAETWDETPPNGSRNPSPAPKAAPKVVAKPVPKVEADAVLTDTDDETLGASKIIDHRRPSTRSQTSWLDSILSRPEKPPARPASQERGGRSRSR